MVNKGGLIELKLIICHFITPNNVSFFSLCVGFIFYNIVALLEGVFEYRQYA